MHKIVKSIRRRFIFIAFHISFFFKREKRINSRLIGSKYGNWYLPNQFLKLLSQQSGICLSGGVGEDISFEYELSSCSQIEFKLYDFTPRSIKYFNNIRDGWRDGITCDDGKIYFENFKIDKFEFIPYGLSAHDQTLMFRPPNDLNHVSWSHATVEEGGECPFQVLGFKTQINKYDRTNLLICKLDIEGSEADILYNDDALICLSSFNIILLEVDYLKSADFFSAMRYLTRVRKLFKTHILFYINDYNIGFMRKTEGYNV